MRSPFENQTIQDREIPDVYPPIAAVESYKASESRLETITGPAGIHRGFPLGEDTAGYPGAFDPCLSVPPYTFLAPGWSGGREIFRPKGLNRRLEMGYNPKRNSSTRWGRRVSPQCTSSA